MKKSKIIFSLLLLFICITPIAAEEHSPRFAIIACDGNIIGTPEIIKTNQTVFHRFTPNIWWHMPYTLSLSSSVTFTATA